MSVDRANKIAQLRKDFIDAEKSQAGLESKLDGLTKQKQAIFDECKALNVEPSQIDARIKEGEDKIDLVINKMQTLKSGGTPAEEAAI